MSLLGYNKVVNPRKYILSIDGGGVRGIITATALVKLEKTTGKLTRDIFSMVAGTSTGAIIAAAVAAGMPAEKIVDLYCKRSKEIFKKYPWNFFKRFFFGYMYNNKNLYNVVSQELGEVRNWQVNNSPIDILITAKRVSDSRQFYFVKDKEANACVTGCLPLVDCVVASAAAPTYFQPWVTSSTTGQKQMRLGALVDGGIGVAGNPVYQACVEAFYYARGYSEQETTVVSLGTGQFVEESSPRWLWDWFEWVLKELLRSPGEQQTELVRRHFPDLLFYRLDPDLKKLDPALEKPIVLDDINSVEKLCEYGTRFASFIDWQKILGGTDTTFRVGKHSTKPWQYKRP